MKEAQVSWWISVAVHFLLPYMQKLCCGEKWGKMSRYYKREKKNHEGKVIYRKSLHYDKAAETLYTHKHAFVINLEFLRLGWQIFTAFIQW